MGRSPPSDARAASTLKEMHHERKYQTSCAGPGGMLVERRLLSRSSVVPFELRLAGGKSVAVLPSCTGPVLSSRGGSSSSGTCSGLQFAGGDLLDGSLHRLQLISRAIRLGGLKNRPADLLFWGRAGSCYFEVMLIQVNTLASLQRPR